LFAAFAAVGLLASPADAGLFGPPKFKIEQSDDRFSTNGTTTYHGLWNRISKKSLAGGVHIDARGVFVDPSVVIKRADGSVAALLFVVHNEVSLDSAGMGDALSFGQLERITFVTGEGEPIALPIDRSTSDGTGPTTYNSISRMASTDVRESGVAAVTPEQYRRIMAAPALLAKIDGSRRSMVYEAKDIAKDFRPNLQKFWAYVEGGR
jgi:hypothetical protein